MAAPAQSRSANLCTHPRPVWGIIQIMKAVTLERENEITLFAVQALLGLISADVVAVAVRAEEDRVMLTFWARRHSPELEEDADDAIFELDALFSGNPEDHPLIETAIHVGEPDMSALRPYGRMIYRAKRPQACPSRARSSGEQR
ncbi:hypothetical protein ACFWC5_33275 [Streptomyces sp. NPDC060085]|uniref:hypothetical protein n=1 Tax=Streptomyces sp. NPDC060085 TaxID=3347054 RepID=UPI00365D0C71